LTAPRSFLSSRRRQALQAVPRLSASARTWDLRGYPEAFVQALTAAGWLAALIPEQYGGAGLSLIEAMQIGMPVLALATTEAIAAVPPDAGVLSTRVGTLVEAAQWLTDEPEAARRLGARARQAALARYGLKPKITTARPHTCDIRSRLWVW